MTAVLSDLSAHIDAIYRNEYAKILAATMRVSLHDLQLAQDCVAEAFARALTQWNAEILPANAAAWLTTVARHLALDRLRRQQTHANKTSLLQQALESSTDITLDVDPAIEHPPFADERLALFFTCCHPALAKDAQIALTLRTLGALSTEAIARAFLVTPATMAQRLVRAKNKIKLAKIPYEIPHRDALSERLDGVLHTLYLIFNEGYRATDGEALLHVDICERAIELARATWTLLPTQPECGGLLALMLFHHARRNARVDDQGDLILLDDQDRQLWHHQEIREATQILAQSLHRQALGPYQIQAAIAAAHSHATHACATDWQQIVALYDHLLAFDDTAVVRLNRAVARSMIYGAQLGFDEVSALEAAGELAHYLLLPAALADLARRLGRIDDARRYYQRALDLAKNASERRFLRRRIEELDS